MLFVSLAACAFLIAQLVRRYDLATREPAWTLLTALALGALGMFIAGQFQLAAIRFIHASGGMVSDATLATLAGVTEETAKLLAAVGVAFIAKRHFNEPLDGLIYGSFAGLGAAIEESVHLLLRREGVEALPPDEIVRLSGHLVMGGIAAFGLGALISRWRDRGWWLAGCFAGAVLLHTLWDVVAFDAHRRHAASGIVPREHALAGVALMLAGMVAFRWLVAVGVRRDRHALAK